MKNILSSLFILLIFNSISYAKTIYVTDTLKSTLRSHENNRSKILKMLPSGTALTILKENPKSGYSKVKVENLTGFILTRHTIPTQVSKWYLDEANKELELLKQEYQLVKDELLKLRGNNSSSLASIETLTLDRDRISNELNDLKQTAANAVQLKHQRDQLQEKRVETERDLKQLKRENQALEDSANQDWFLYGGILALLGVIIGFILPKLSWRHKTNNWDTF